MREALIPASFGGVPTDVSSSCLKTIYQILKHNLHSDAFLQLSSAMRLTFHQEAKSIENDRPFFLDSKRTWFFYTLLTKR
jgi:hypothetical protein